MKARSKAKGKAAISPVMRAVSGYIATALRKPVPAKVAECTKHHLLDTLAAMREGQRKGHRVLGVVNAVVRPLVVLFTLPLTVLTLGLFLFVINAAMFGLVAWLLPGLRIAGFVSALLGSLIVSFTSWVASRYIGPTGRVEILVVRG